MNIAFVALAVVAAVAFSGAVHAQAEPALTEQERAELDEVLKALDSYEGPLTEAQAELQRELAAWEKENAERERQGLHPLVFPAPSAPDPPIEQEFPDGSGWLLISPVEWTIGNTAHEIVVPAGFTHDKASVPQALQWLVGRTGRHTRAATVHDYLYWKQDCSPEQSDNLMLIAMKETGVIPVVRSLIYRAVRLGGRSAWAANEKDRKAGHHRIFPAQHVYRDTSLKTLRASVEEMYGRDVSNLTFAEKVSQEACSLGDSVEVPGA